jgi:hypothetical protein
MVIDGKRKKTVITGVMYFMVLFLAFSINIFGTGYGQDWFASFQADSSRIVEKTAECKDKSYYNGPLYHSDDVSYVEAMERPGCSSDVYAPYVSQFGLQARAVAAFAPADGEAALLRYFKVIELAIAASMAAVLTVFLLKIRSLFGRFATWSSLAGLVLAPWVVAFARNMYWVEFTLFLPFIFSFVFYEWFQARRKLSWFYAIIALLMLLKCLSGYEYITTIAVSALVPVVFYELWRRKTAVLALWRHAAAVVAAAVVAVGGAMLINTAALSSYYGDWGKAYHAVTARAEARSIDGLSGVQQNVVGGIWATTPGLYPVIDRLYDLDQLKSGHGNPLVYALLSGLNYAMLPAISLPIVISEPIGTILQSMLAFVAYTALVLAWLGKKNRIETSLHRALTWAYWLSLVGSLSWLVLMPAHAYPHAHINGIIFYLPTLLITYIVMGIFIGTWLRSGKQKVVRGGKK